MIQLCRIAVTALLIAVTASPSAAQPSISGVSPPVSLSVSGQDLTLAGCGVREMLWMHLYVIGLYLPQARMPPSQMLDADTPKALRLYAVYEGEVPHQMPDEWRDPLQRKLPPEALKTVQQFSKAISSQDVANIAYAPGKGTTLQINGQPFAETQDHQLMQALLELWVGPNPVSESVKGELLEGSC